MNYSSSTPSSLPAPCIIDQGILVNKDDMRRVLSDLNHVRYTHLQDGRVISQGEGYVLEVFGHPSQATLVANHTLYLNVCSFDYLQLQASPDLPLDPIAPPSDGSSCYFDLVQDNRCLRLHPLSSPLQGVDSQSLNAAALEAMVTEVLSASWDAHLDDDDHQPF
jgi:hypothetical protein